MNGFTRTHRVMHLNNKKEYIWVPDPLFWPKTGVKLGILSKNREYTP